MRQATVLGPTPPGTGVRTAATSLTLRAQSPVTFPPATLFSPTSTMTTPGLRMFLWRRPGTPAADTTRSGIVKLLQGWGEGNISTSRAQGGYQVSPGGVPVTESRRHVKPALALVSPEDDLNRQSNIVRSTYHHRVTRSSAITNRQDLRVSSRLNVPTWCLRQK